MDIPLPSAIKRSVKQNKVIGQVKELLKDIPDLRDHRCSDALALVVCSAIENLIKPKHKLDKEELAIQIFQALFIDKPLTDDEIKQLKARIAFLVENGLVKKIPLSTWVLGGLARWAKKKLL